MAVDPRPILLRQELDTPEARLGHARDVARKMDLAFSHLWAMQILPRADGTGNLTVNGTAFTLVPGCSVTFTPAVATRIAVPIKADVSLQIAGAGVLNLQVFVNGSATAGAKVLAYQTATVGDRVPVADTFHYDLQADVTYVLELRAALSAAGATYLVVGNNGRTGLGPIVAIPNLG